MLSKRSGVIAGLLAATGFALTAQAGDVDIVFVVDESGSMGGEHAWLGTMITALNAGLVAHGQNPRYGLVGFGATNPAPHQINVGGGQFGTAAQFATATGSLVVNGGTEDGYAGIDFAMGYSFRPGAAQNYILVTDEDRDNFNGNSFSFGGLRTALNARNALLNVVVDAALDNGSNLNPVLGITGKSVGSPPLNPNAKNYREDGAGGFLIGNGGRVTSAFGTTETDYIDLAFGIGFVGPNGPVHGGAWDLNQLRLGGLTATSFTAAFIDLKIQEIIQQTVPLPAGVWMGLAGLTGFAVVRRRRA